MKILVVCSAYPPNIKGGGEKSTQILAQGLSAKGHQVQVVTVADEAREYLDTDGKTQIKQFLSSNIYWNFRSDQSIIQKLVWHALDNYNPVAVRMIERELTEFNPDIVISSTIENFGPAVWQACYRKNIPVVHILRSYYIRCFKGTMFSKNENCNKPCIKCSILTAGRRNATQYVSGVIGISKFILDQHSDLFPTALRSTIPNAVPAKANTTPRRKSQETHTFGYMGRLEPEKGILEVLQTFKKMPNNYKLIVAGRGKSDYESKLITEFASDRIKFLGWVDADVVYSQIDFAIIPSMWNEPFGRIVIEAFAQGIPVIASARGGLSELVTEGRTGYLFEPLDTDALKNACIRAANNTFAFDAMVDAVKTEANLYKPNIIIDEYEKFFKRIFQNTKSNSQIKR
jgi:glycosyltransferase involved in cell wall biosynthesis